MTGPSGLASRSRQGGRRPDSRPLSGDLPPPRRNLGFRSRSLMAGLCHGFRIMAIWALAPRISGRGWLTLPGCFRHKRAQPGALYRVLVLTASMASSVAILAEGLAMRLSGGVSRVAKGADCK